MVDPKSILLALARQQAQDLNQSPFSRAVNSDIKRNASAVASALMAPGNALRGEYSQTEIEPSGYVRPFSGGLMDAASNMAGVVSLGSVPMARPVGSLGMGGAPRPPQAISLTPQRVSALEKWMGNSQVRNPDGSPMTVYHGTEGNFDTFRIPRDGAGNERAVYFSPDPAVASQSAAGKGSVIPAYVKAENLLTIDMKGGATDALGRSREAIVRQAREAGYDGVLLKNTGDVGGNQDQYAVFNPAQIKSAIGNSGAYNPSDPNIVRLSGVPIVSGEKDR